MTDEEATLFGGYEPAERVDEHLSPDRRRTLRQIGQVSAGIHPLTGGRLHDQATRHRAPTDGKRDPFTCGSCWFRGNRGGVAGSYPKCWAGDGARVTGGPATDVRAWWPACPDYTPADRDLSPDAARTVYPAPEA